MTAPDAPPRARIGRMQGGVFGAVAGSDALIATTRSDA
jgi:hypothetical protein